MAQVNFDEIKQWNSVPISSLYDMLREQGFDFNKTASFGDHRVFTNFDARVNIVIDRNHAKVYANGNNKLPVHSFSIVSGTPKGYLKAPRAEK